jgi:hypothetical protein
MPARHTNRLKRSDAVIEPVSSCHSDTLTRVAGETGSAMLRDRMLAEFARFEENHRLPQGVGARLLMNGRW